MNRYFSNLSSTNKNFIGLSSTPNNSNTSEILFYKLGEHIYIPYRPVPLNSILLTGQFNENNFVKLDWVTTGEKNIASFELQRSNPNGNFDRIAILNSQGDSDDEQYYFYNDDISALKKSNNLMYRILVRDIDGNTSYSNIINLSNQSNEIAHVFPNPFSTELNIALNSINHGDIKITLSDLSGRVILTDEIPAASTITTKKISIPTSIKIGIYFIEIVDEESGMKEVLKVVR